jgi:hypothetical protein
MRNGAKWGENHEKKKNPQKLMAIFRNNIKLHNCKPKRYLAFSMGQTPTQLGGHRSDNGGGFGDTAPHITILLLLLSLVIMSHYANDSAIEIAIKILRNVDG